MQPDRCDTVLVVAKIDDKIVLEESEADRVFMWRYEALLRAGIPDEHAGVVAASDFDLHDALKMVKAGCDPHLLARITM